MRSLFHPSESPLLSEAASTPSMGFHSFYTAESPFRVYTPHQARSIQRRITPVFSFQPAHSQSTSGCRSTTPVSMNQPSLLQRRSTLDSSSQGTGVSQTPGDQSIEPPTSITLPVRRCSRSNSVTSLPTPSGASPLEPPTLTQHGSANVAFYPQQEEQKQYLPAFKRGSNMFEVLSLRHEAQLFDAIKKGATLQPVARYDVKPQVEYHTSSSSTIEDEEDYQIHPNPLFIDPLVDPSSSDVQLPDITQLASVRSVSATSNDPIPPGQESSSLIPIYSTSMSITELNEIHQQYTANPQPKEGDIDIHRQPSAANAVHDATLLQHQADAHPPPRRQSIAQRLVSYQYALPGQVYYAIQNKLSRGRFSKSRGSVTSRRGSATVNEDSPQTSHASLSVSNNSNSVTFLSNTTITSPTILAETQSGDQDLFLAPSPHASHYHAKNRRLQSLRRNKTAANPATPSPSSQISSPSTASLSSLEYLRSLIQETAGEYTDEGSPPPPPPPRRTTPREKVYDLLPAVPSPQLLTAETVFSPLPPLSPITEAYEACSMEDDYREDASMDGLRRSTSTSSLFNRHRSLSRRRRRDPYVDRTLTLPALSSKYSEYIESYPTRPFEQVPLMVIYFSDSKASTKATAASEDNPSTPAQPSSNLNIDLDLPLELSQVFVLHLNYLWCQQHLSFPSLSDDTYCPLQSMALSLLPLVYQAMRVDVEPDMVQVMMLSEFPDRWSCRSRLDHHAGHPPPSQEYLQAGHASYTKSMNMQVHVDSTSENLPSSDAFITLASPWNESQRSVSQRSHHYGIASPMPSHVYSSKTTPARKRILPRVPLDTFSSCDQHDDPLECAVRSGRRFKMNLSARRNRSFYRQRAPSSSRHTTKQLPRFPHISKTILRPNHIQHSEEREQQHKQENYHQHQDYIDLRRTTLSSVSEQENTKKQWLADTHIPQSMRLSNTTVHGSGSFNASSRSFPLSDETPDRSVCALETPPMSSRFASDWGGDIQNPSPSSFYMLATSIDDPIMKQKMQPKAVSPSTIAKIVNNSEKKRQLFSPVVFFSHFKQHLPCLHQHSADGSDIQLDEQDSTDELSPCQESPLNALRDIELEEDDVGEMPQFENSSPIANPPLSPLRRPTDVLEHKPALPQVPEHEATIIVDEEEDEKSDSFRTPLLSFKLGTSSLPNMNAHHTAPGLSARPITLIHTTPKRIQSPVDPTAIRSDISHKMLSPTESTSFYSDPPTYRDRFADYPSFFQEPISHRHTEGSERPPHASDPTPPLHTAGNNDADELDILFPSTSISVKDICWDDPNAQQHVVTISHDQSTQRSQAQSSIKPPSRIQQVDRYLIEEMMSPLKKDLKGGGADQTASSLVRKSSHGQEKSPNHEHQLDQRPLPAVPKYSSEYDEKCDDHGDYNHYDHLGDHSLSILSAPYTPMHQAYDALTSTMRTMPLPEGGWRKLATKQPPEKYDQHSGSISTDPSSFQTPAATVSQPSFQKGSDGTPQNEMSIDNQHQAHSELMFTANSSTTHPVSRAETGPHSNPSVQPKSHKMNTHTNISMHKRSTTPSHHPSSREIELAHARQHERMSSSSSESTSERHTLLKELKHQLVQQQFEFQKMFAEQQKQLELVQRQVGLSLPSISPPQVQSGMYPPTITLTSMDYTSQHSPIEGGAGHDLHHLQSMDVCSLGHPQRHYAVPMQSAAYPHYWYPRSHSALPVYFLNSIANPIPTSLDHERGHDEAYAQQSQPYGGRDASGVRHTPTPSLSSASTILIPPQLPLPALPPQHFSSQSGS